MTATKEIIEAYLDKNRRKLPGLSYCYGKDTNQDREEQFYSAGLKILVTHMSTGDTRSVSNTFNCISTLFHLGGKEGEIFTDVCYMPEQETREAFKRDGIPFMFGNVSHEPWYNYDVVCMSQAIMPEVFNFPLMFENSGVPMTMEEREKGKCPIFLYGGAASSMGFSILGGKVDDRGKGLYDIGLIGAGEPTLPVIAEELLRYNREFGIKNKREGLIEWLMQNSKIRDYFMIPNKYEVHLADDNVTITAIDRLDERTPEKVLMGRMYQPDFKGFNRKIFNVSGANASSGDVQISAGCSGSGSCAFCLEAQEAGHWTEKPIEQVRADVKETKRMAAPNTLSPFSFNSNYYNAYFDMLNLFAGNGSNLSLINQRMDIIGAEPKYLELARKMGLKRASCAVEGCGDRVRNHILNKNLTRAQMMAAVTQIFKQKLMMLKMG